MMKFGIKIKISIIYLVTILIIFLTSLYYFISIVRKDNVIKSSKRIKPPKHIYRNKVTVVNDSIENINDKVLSFKNRDKIDENTKMISSFKKYITNTIDSMDELKNMNLLREKTDLHRILWERLFGTDIFTYNHILKSIFKYQRENESLFNLYNKVHKNLYPWIYGKRFLAIDELIGSFHGRGIVICTGSFHFKYIQSTIDTLRNLIKTKLPIEVFYNGEDDLTIEEQQILLAYSKVYLSNLEEYFNDDIIKCKNWAIKPFAILASRFTEVILIDADIFFIRDPAELFKSKGYEETGTLFFRDRTISKNIPNESLLWFKEWTKNPLEETKSLRFWNGLTIHEMDSSTIVINKEKAILGLLSVCKLNEYAIRKGIIYRYVYNNKETFWMGFDLAHQHYYMSPQPITFIGSIQPTSQENSIENVFCGHIAHTMEDKQIVFWKGHLEVNEFDNSNMFLDFNSYITEKDNDDRKWSNEPPFCYYIENEEDVILLSKNEKAFINMIIEREYNNRLLYKS